MNDQEVIENLDLLLSLDVFSSEDSDLIESLEELEATHDEEK